MNAREVIIQGAGSERGAVAVLVALLLPVLLMITSLVLDVGNWFGHERQLQLQADAGALAGGQGFTAQGCDPVGIKNAAMQYSGITGGTTPVFNKLDKSTPVLENINQQAYPTQPNQPPSDPTPMTGNPCTDELLDLKLTETDLPWFLQLFPLVHGGINAHARVSVRQENTAGAGFMPFVVSETTPVAARAYFIDESNGTQLYSVALTQTGTNAQGQAIWSNPSALPVTISQPNIGVIVALSGDRNNTTCGQALVSCYDQTPGPSLVHVQGWSATGTGSISGTTINAFARSVTLQPGSGGTPCVDGYFSNSSTDCSFGISAKIDIGAAPNPPGVTVAALVTGTSYPLSYNTSGPNAGLWTGPATLPTGTGSNQIDLKITCTKGTGAPCSATTSKIISDVQRAYAASSVNSGTIDSAVISENSIGDANSFLQGSTHNLTVTVAVNGSLANAQTVSDPLYHMRFGNNGPNDTGAVGCPAGNSGSNFRNNVANGCPGSYGINTTYPTCNMGTPPPPQDCFPGLAGFKTGPFRQGLATRFMNQTCPNNWSQFPKIPHGDARVVHLFVTSFGALANGGVNPFPIVNFATFYVTGYDGDPCTSDDQVAKDEIVGHFIKYIDFVNSGGGSNQSCNLASFGACVVVLTQ